MKEWTGEDSLAERWECLQARGGVAVFQEAKGKEGAMGFWLGKKQKK